VTLAGSVRSVADCDSDPEARQITDPSAVVDICLLWRESGFSSFLAQGGNIPISPSRGVAVAFLGTLLLAAAAFGQNPLPSGNLYITALDEDQRVLSGVTVILRGPGAPRTAVTDDRGDVRFLNLSPGVHFLTLESRGLETVQRRIDIDLGRNAVLTVTMPVAGAAEAVAVSVAQPVDSRTTETGSTFNQDELARIPTTRDPWAVLRMVPGVLLDNVNVGGMESAQQSIFVGKGSHSDQNTYNLDGVAITDMSYPGSTPIYFDFDSLDAIEVLTGGSDPALATPGVAVNLVTKRGTNELRGSGRYVYSGDVQDFGLEVGGPIFKDRLWLWGAGARTEVNAVYAILSTGGTATRRTTLDHWNAKLNAQILPQNSLTLSYLHFEKTILGRGQSAYRPPETTWDQSYPNSAYRVEDSHVFSANLFASVYFSSLDDDFTLMPRGGLEEQAVADADGVWHNSYQFYRSRSSQRQAGLTASSFFHTGSLNHELRFGFGYKRAISDSLSSWPGDGLFGLEYSNLASVTRDANVKIEMNYYDAYLSDTLSSGNLTVNAGLRFDYQRGRNLPSTVPANPVFPDLLPAVSYPGDPGYPITWREVEPRIGVTYALGRERKTLLRTSYSRFAGQLGPEIRSVNSFPSVAYLYYGWEDTNGNHHVDRDEVDLSDLEDFAGVDPDNPGSSIAVNRIARNFSTPLTDEIILGVDRQLLPDFSASVSYTHRWARNLEFRPLVDTDVADYQFIGNATGAGIDPSGFSLEFDLPYYGLTTYPPPLGFEIRNRPAYRESYDGLELQLTKRLSHGWALRGSFAYNDWKKHVGPAAVFNPNNIRGGSNADGGAVVEPSSNNYKSGVFINAKWQLNVSGSVQLPLAIQLGANFFGRQGYVIPYSVRVITHDSRFSRPFLQIGNVDDFRLPNVYQLDLRLEKVFRMGSRITASPTVDCFNVLDRRTVLQRVSDVGTYDADKDPSFEQNAYFNAVDERQAARTFRVGIRISF
jgi:Carboxypeptidase regulatory-like domain/TonB-dependent Receptor Plug Domain